jgi:hypothetical protein
MTISNKYNVDFCVLKIKVVGYAHEIGINIKMVENLFSIIFGELMVVKSGSIYAKNPLHCMRESGGEHGQDGRIESGAVNQV